MVQVSEIEKLHGRKVRVTFDNGSTYLLLQSTYMEQPLEVGDEVDIEKYDQWVQLKQYRSALDKAVAMLAKRSFSKGEIRQRLGRTGYSENTIEMVIFKLEKNHLLNDKEFSSQWVQYRFGQKYGPKRIFQELYNKGISTEEAENALKVISERNQLEAALILAQKAYKQTKANEAPYKTRQKMLAYIVRRGYDWDLARQAVDMVFKFLD